MEKINAFEFVTFRNQPFLGRVVGIEKYFLQHQEMTIKTAIRKEPLQNHLCSKKGNL